MNEGGVPTLEVGFAIETGGSFDNLMRLQSVMDSTEGRIVAEAAKIEKATGGMVKLGGATAQITTFGNAATRELQASAKEMTRAEKAGEALSRQLDRQATAFGKSREELRAMKVEAVALAAEQKGLTELAQRLRAQESALYDQEFAAMRRARQEVDALAEDKAVAAQRAVAAAEMEAQAMRDASFAYQMFEARAREGGRALREQEAAAVADANAVARLREMLDPATAAQDRLNQELIEARRVMTAAGAGAEELARVEKMLVTNGGAHVVSMGQQKAGAQQLAFQFQDLGVQFASAAGSGNVFKGVMTGLAMQGPQVVQAISMMRTTAGGFISFLAGPWGAIIMAATSVLAVLGAEFLTSGKKAKDGAKDVDQYTAALQRMTQAMGKASLMDMGLSKVNLAKLTGDIRNLDATISQTDRTWGNRDVYNALIGQKRDLETKAWNLQATIGGVEKAVAAQQKLVKLGEADAAALKAATAARREHNKELTAAAAAARADAKEQENLAKWLNETRLAAQGGVQGLAADQAKRQQEWGVGDPTYGDVLKQQSEEAETMERVRKEGAQQVLDIYLQQLSVLHQMGGAAGTVAGLLAGFADGNFSGVSGTLGKLLQGMSLSVGKDGWKAVTDKLDSIFGAEGGGSFARIMQKTFAAGGIGSLAGSMAFGSNNSSMGSFIGGAIGDKVGEKFLSKGMETIAKGLGDFAGPLGSIVGGLLGGALGGLFSKAKWGTSVVSGQASGDVSSAGNKAGYTANAGLAAGSIQNGLQSIADQFDADVGNYLVSIGQYKGKWRVSTTGRTGKLKGGSGRTDIRDFGEDGAEDAIKFAIADAIKDGALLGLRSSTQTLLQAGSDVERQLTKALQFEGVFSDLQSMLDPVGFAVTQLDREFTQLRKVFDEAGASVEEYAKLQQLYDLKRADALEKANEEALSLTRDQRTLEARILELQGKELQSVAIMRQIELEQMKESLRPLQQQVWALEDAQEAVKAAEALSDAWTSVGDSIMDEVKRIRGLTGADQGGGFAMLQGQFNAANMAAIGGDQDAAKSLPGLSQSLLSAAALVATSRQELDRVQAQTAAALEATYGAIGLIIAGGAAPTTASTLAAAATAATATGATTANDNSNVSLAAKLDAVTAELSQLRGDLNAGQAVIASNTGAVKRHLDNVTGASGGDAISTVAA